MIRPRTGSNDANLRPQLLLTDRRRSAQEPSEDRDDPARGQVVEVQEGHDRSRPGRPRFGPRELIFDAVIDRVEVKRLADLSPREITHDNPELRRTEEMLEFLSQLYNRPVSGEDTVTVIQFSEILQAQR